MTKQTRVARCTNFVSYGRYITRISHCSSELCWTTALSHVQPHRAPAARRWYRPDRRLRVEAQVISSVERQSGSPLFCLYRRAPRGRLCVAVGLDHSEFDERTVLEYLRRRSASALERPHTVLCTRGGRASMLRHLRSQCVHELMTATRRLPYGSGCASRCASPINLVAS